MKNIKKIIFISMLVTGIVEQTIYALTSEKDEKLLLVYSKLAPSYYKKLDSIKTQKDLLKFLQSLSKDLKKSLKNVLTAKEINYEIEDLTEMEHSLKTKKWTSEEVQATVFIFKIVLYAGESI